MQGRAASVVLPALVVLALVAVVGIASTGSTPGRSGNTRPPSATLVDALYSVALVAVALGAILFLFGLTQRKAIAREIASGRYRRNSLLAWVVFMALFTGVTYWRFTEWEPPTLSGEDGFAFPGDVPTQTAPQAEPAPAYDPGLSWPVLAIVVGLLAAAVVAYFVAERRARRGKGTRAVLAEQLAAALDETLDDLRAETDARRAIIAAYARLERVLAANGVPRRESETPDEYVSRVLAELELTPDAIGLLTALFTEAKFSHHDVDSTMKENAISALERIRDELRTLRDGQHVVVSPSPRAATL